MKWFMLFLACVMEVTWAVAMKYSHGFTAPIASVVTAVGYIASAIFLSLALRELPLGTTYITWGGFGLVGTTVAGTLLFHESLTPGRILCILLIMTGIVGLQLLSDG